MSLFYKVLNVVGKKHDGLALALGGGNIKGLVHVGILKALTDAGIKISAISGTSAGSIAAAFYASGASPKELEDIAMNLDWFSIIFPRFTKTGFFSGKKIENLIEKKLSVKTFGETKIPLFIVATDAYSGKPYVFKHKNESIALAVRASCTIPGLFVPVEYEDKLLIDGSFSNNLPLSCLNSLGKKYYRLGVNIIPRGEMSHKPSSFFNVLSRAHEIQEITNFDKYCGQYDLLLEPLKEYVSVHAHNKTFYKKMIELGYQEVERNIDKIKRYV